MSKRLLKEIEQCCYLYIDDNTGIAWIEDGRTNSVHKHHIHFSMKTFKDGIEMKEQGYWEKTSKLIEGNNGICFNISEIYKNSELDNIVAEHCQCEECRKIKLVH